jgi:hypothetical protein
MAVGTRMQQRRAPEATWAASGYILAEGEFGVTTDTGIIKIGDGVNAWSALNPAFDSEYLPILGTAANSNLLGGVSVASLVKVADTDTNPTNNTYVQRSSTGTIKAATAVAATEVVNKAQMEAFQLEPVVRTVTGATTLALTDIGKMIFVQNVSTTTQMLVTIPLNATVAFPIGAWVDICASDVGVAKMIPFNGTVGLYGKVHAMGGLGVVRMLKIGTDQWLGIAARQGRLPTYKIRRTVAGDNYGSAYAFVPFDTVDTSDTYNPDSEWFSIPGTGMATARRIIVNQAGEYEFTAAMASNGTGGLTYCRLTSMTADNSTTGMKPFAVQSMTAVAVVTARRRVVAGESFGVHHGFAAGNLGKADAEATGGDPHHFKIVRIGD